MLQKIILTLVLINLSSCVTPRSAMNESMLPNGDWAFKLAANYSCLDQYTMQNNAGQIVDFNALNDVFKKTEETAPLKSKEDIETARVKCIEDFKSSLSKRSQELCGDKYELYGCLNSESIAPESQLYHNTEFGYYMTCYMRCAKK